jgi:glycosyltransferase involved in cell wall biosynthesis
MPALTVLICTHNRRPLLEKAMDSLDRTRPPEGWTVNVFVMANACSDDTLAWLAQRSGQLPLRFDHEPLAGKSNALNRALPLMDSDCIAFVDDDHRVDEGYIEAVCRAFDARPDADLLCGRILPDWDGTEPAWVHDTGPYRIYPLPVPRFDLGDTTMDVSPDVAIPGGGNLAIRTAWCAKIGAFSTELGPQGHDLGGAEDLEWVKRALALNARLVYAPDMIQYHYVDGARLRTDYVVRKAFIRSSSVARIDGTRPAAYMLRKAAGYFGSAATSLSGRRRRHYLVRLAAALGELHGALKNR